MELDEIYIKGMSGMLSHKEIDRLPKEYNAMKKTFHEWRQCGHNPEFMNYSRFKTIMKLMKIYTLYLTKHKKTLFYINPINYWNAYRDDYRMRKKYKYAEKIASKPNFQELIYGNLRLLSQSIIEMLISFLGKYTKMKAVSFTNNEYTYVGKYERFNCTTVFRISNRPCAPNDIDSYIKEADIADDENVRFISVVICFEEEKSKILGEYIFSSEEIQRNMLHDKLKDDCKKLLLGELVDVCGKRPENEEGTMT